MIPALDKTENSEINNHSFTNSSATYPRHTDEGCLCFEAMVRSKLLTMHTINFPGGCGNF